MESETKPETPAETRLRQPPKQAREFKTRCCECGRVSTSLNKCPRCGGTDLDVA